MVILNVPGLVSALEKLLKARLHLQFLLRFQCDFLHLTDVKESINNECSEYMFLHLNIRVWFTRSHPSKGENRARNRNKSCKCKRFPLQSFCPRGRSEHVSTFAILGFHYANMQ